MAKKPTKKAGKLTPIREVSHYEIRHIDTKEVVGKSANQMSATKALKRYGSKSHYSAPVYKDEIEAEKAKKKAQREAERDERKSIEEAKRKAEREKKNANLAQKREAEKVKREAERNKKKIERDSEREAKKVQREAEKAERDALRQAEREAKKIERQSKQKTKTKWGLTASEYEKYHADSVKESKSYNKKEPIKDEKGKFTTDVEKIIRMVVDNADTMDANTRRKYLKFIRSKIPGSRYREIVDSLPESTAGYTHDGNSKKSSQKRLEREKNNLDPNEAIKPMHGPTGNKLPEEPETTSDPTKPKRRLFKGFGRGILGFAAGIKDGARDITRHATSNMWRQYKQNFRKVLLHGGEGSFHPIDKRYKETWIGSKAGITSSSGGTNTAKTMGSAGARSRITDGINKVNAQLEDVVLSTRRIENTLNKLLYAQVNNTKEQSVNNVEGEEGNARENGGWRGLLGGPRPSGAGSTRGTRNAIRFGRGLIRYGGPALAVIGGGMAAANEFGESGNIGRAASTGIGSTAGAVGGGWAGAKAGALLGTAIGGPVGTVIGGLGGMALGGYLGSHAGETVGRFGYDAITQNGRETEQSLRNNETRNRLLNNANSEMSIISSTYSVNARSDISFTTPTKLHFKAGSIVFEGSITTSNSSSNTGTPTIPQSNGSPNIGNIPGIGQIPNQGSATGPQIGTPQSPQSNSAPQGTASDVRRSNVFRGGNAGGDRGIPQSAATEPQRPIVPGFSGNIGGGLFGAIPNSVRPQGTTSNNTSSPSANTPSSLMMRSIMSAETGNLGSPTDPRRFIRTRVTPEQNRGAPGDGHSSAYGPNQLTRDWLKRFRDRHGASLPQEEREYLNGLIEQGNKMLQTSRAGNYRDPVHGFGGTGTMGQTERQRQLYGQIAQRGMIDAVRNSRSYEDFIRQYRGMNDGGYFRKIQREAQRLGTTPEQLYNQMRTMRPSDLPSLPDPNAPNGNQAGGNSNNSPIPTQSQMRSIPGLNSANPNLIGIPLSPDNNPTTSRNALGAITVKSSGGNNITVNPSDPTTMRGQAFGGGDTHRGVLSAAQVIQGSFPDTNRFTGFNDRYHAGTRSRHAGGLAGDFTTRSGGGAEAAAHVRRIMNRAELVEGRDYRVMDEYARPSRRATGGHVHYEFMNPQAAQKFHEASQTPAFRREFNLPENQEPLRQESREDLYRRVGPLIRPQDARTGNGDIKYKAEMLDMSDPRTDPRPVQANTTPPPRPFQNLPEDGRQRGSIEVGRESLAVTGRDYIARRRAANTPRPFQNLPEDSGQQGSNFVATGREFLHGNGANYVAQRRAASTTPPPRPFQGLPEDGMQQGSNFTAIGRQALATSAANYIAQRRASQQAQQIQFAQRAIEDGKMANKMAIEQSLPPPSQSRGSPSATETSRPTTPQSNAPTRMTAPSETATPSGRFAEELNSRGSGAIVEPIENSNMSLQKSANKISQ